MNCPACFNKLTERRTSSVLVDVCEGGCGGIWFDAFELSKVDDQDEQAAEALLNIHRDERLMVDHARKRECPRCDGIKLKRHFFSARRQVQVDQCPNCAGYWLDAGELEKVRAERAESAERAGSDQNISMEVIRYLYRLRPENRES